MKLGNINKIITHANCPDGKVSAIILQKVYPNAEFVFLSPSSSAHEQLEPEDSMLFCDFSPHPNTYKKFLEKEVYVLDHHSSAKDIVLAFGERGRYADEATEIGVSGGVLAYEEVYKPQLGPDSKLAKMAMLCGVRDLFVKDSPYWLQACQQAAALHFFDEQYILTNGLKASDLKLGKYLFLKQMNKAEDIIRNRTIVRGKLGITTTKEISDVADYGIPILGLDIMSGFALVVDEGQVRVIVSLRAAGKVDVGLIAKANGGGGHKNAAGFSFMLTGNNVLEEVIGRIERTDHWNNYS